MKDELHRKIIVLRESNQLTAQKYMHTKPADTWYVKLKKMNVKIK